MTLKLYHFDMSGPSRAAVLAARAIDLPIELIILDLLKREQFGEDFLKMNPQHCVPTMDDEGFILSESRAIAIYLMEKYAPDDSFYPKDLQKRAVVNQRLFFDSSNLYVKIRAICFPILFLGEKCITKELKDDLNITLGHLDTFLSATKWVAGDQPTIADTAIYASMSSIIATDYAITNYPNIIRWVDLCQAKLRGAEENDIGAKKFGEAVKANMQQGEAVDNKIC